MLRILLVEDEFYFRQALKVMLPWNEMGFEICGESNNGSDALDRIDTLRPDIALVDINMPNMSGLEFANRLKQKNSGIKIIFLTGCDDFSYAKQAIPLGVCDYLLKPVKKEELRESLLNVSRVIEEELKRKKQALEMSGKARENVALLKDRILNQLIQGKLPQSKSETAYLEDKFCMGNYQVYVLESKAADTVLWKGEEQKVWMFAIANVAMELLGQTINGGYCYDAEDRICIIAQYEKMPEQGGKQLFQTLEEIRKTIFESLHLRVRIGAGDAYTDLYGVSASYKEAVYALRNGLVLKETDIFLYRDIYKAGTVKSAFTPEQRNSMMMSMRLNNADQVIAVIESVFQSIDELRLPADAVYITCLELISACKEFLVETGQKNEFFENAFAISDQINRMDNLNSLEDMLKGIFRDVLEHTSTHKNSTTSQIVEKVIGYISDNYGDRNLKMEEVANKFYVNFSYRCIVFKKQTGMTLNDYLVALRLTKAKELMDSGSDYVQKIADEVGYEDANYFSKCFKKRFGVTPSNYIQKAAIGKA